MIALFISLYLAVGCFIVFGPHLEEMINEAYHETSSTTLIVVALILSLILWPLCIKVKDDLSDM